MNATMRNRISGMIATVAFCKVMEGAALVAGGSDKEGIILAIKDHVMGFARGYFLTISVIDVIRYIRYAWPNLVVGLGVRVPPLDLHDQSEGYWAETPLDHHDGGYFFGNEYIDTDGEQDDWSEFGSDSGDSDGYDEFSLESGFVTDLDDIDSWSPPLLRGSHTPPYHGGDVGFDFDRIDLDNQSGPYDTFIDFCKDRKRFITDICVSHAINDPRVPALLESHVFLVMNLYQCTTLSHAITTLSAHISAVYTDKGVYDVVKRYLDTTFFGMDNQALDASTLKGVWDSWKTMQGTDLVIKFKKLFAVLAAAGVCSIASLGFSPERFETAWASKAFDTIVSHNLLSYGVEAFICFYNCGLRAWNSGSIWSFFVDPDIIKFDTDYSALVSQENMVYTGTFSDDHDIKTVGEFRVLLAETIEYIEAKLKLKDVSESTKNILRVKHKNLIVIKDKLIAFNNSQNVRAAPWACMLWGATGVGKTCLLALIENVLMRRNGIKSDPKHWVSLNGDDKYMSEYNQTHLGVIMDDTANIKADYAEGVSCGNVIKMVNNIPMPVLKAEVELKGKVYMEPRWVIVTTNVKDIDAVRVSNAPISVARRMNLIIRVRVRLAFQLLVGGVPTGMLDKSKLKDVGTNDVWEFDVQTAMPDLERNPDSHDIKYVDVPGMTGVGIDALLKYIGDDSVAHAAGQDKFVKGSRAIFEEELCPHGSYKGVCCDCALENQSMDTVLLDHLMQQKWWRDNWCARAPGVNWFQRQASEQVLKYHFSGNWVTTALLGLLVMWTSGLGFVAALAGGPLLLLSMYAAIVVRGVRYLRILKTISSMSLRDLANYQAKNWMKTLTMLTGVVSVVGILKFALSARGLMENQGSVHSLPKPDENPKDNPWVKAHVVPQELHINMHRASHKDLAAIVSSKICSAGFTGPNSGQRTCIMPVYANLWLVPHHVVKNCHTKVEGFYVSDPSSISKNFRVFIGPGSWVRIGQTDLALMCIPGAGDQRDLRKLFPITHTKDGVSAEFIYRDSSCEVITGDVRVEPRMVDVIGTSGTYHAMSGHYPFPTKVGMCGGVLLTNTITPYIAGLHVAGAANGGTFGQSCQVTIGEIEAAAGELYKDPMNPRCASYTKLELQSSKFNVTLTGSLHDKSPFNFQESGGNVLLYGAHNQERRRLRSRCETSVISRVVEEVTGVPSNHAAPMNYGNYKPWNLDAKGMLDVQQLPIEVVRPAFVDYSRDVADILASHPDEVARISPLIHEAVLSGVDGCVGIDAVDLKTSAGWPYNTPKLRYVDIDPYAVDGITRVIVPVPEMQAEIDEVESTYREGYRSHLAFRVSLKDEPTKLGKEKVRTIAGAPFALLYLCRKYYLPVAKFIRDHALDFETAVGITAQGPEWDRLAKHLNRRGDGNKVAGDYAAYDTSMCCLVTYLAFAIMIQIAVAAGYSDSDIVVMRSIATEICNPVYEFNGEFVKGNGSMPSGHPMTVFINGIVNCFYVRIAYYIIMLSGLVQLAGLGVHPLALADVPRFKEKVTLVTYGDDNVMDVDRDLPLFNHTSISEALATVGLKYTMADKTAKSIPYIPLSEVTFLKRSFILDVGTGCYFAPLEEASLFKMLHCNLSSVALTPLEQAAQNLETFCEEAFWHGETYYNMRLAQLIQVVDRCGLCTYLRGGCLPTYITMRAFYMARYSVYLSE